MNAPDRLRGIPRLWRAARVGLQVLIWAARHEEAIRLELIGVVILIPLGLWLGEDGVERALLCGSVLLVLVVELLNTGLETVVDRIGTEYHALSGRAKDFGSAAVLIALLLAALTWLLILLQ
ncbi:MAG TPA: diacylglycerol kinase [Gammaproteobacteria bacterium]|nr:diacylglycerol kinase [Gammaproteobacteria bacterium]